MTPEHHLPADIERTSLSIITAELETLGVDAVIGDYTDLGKLANILEV